MKRRLTPQLREYTDGKYGWALPKLKGDYTCYRCKQKLDFSEINYFCVKEQLLFCACIKSLKMLLPCERNAMHRQQEHTHYRITEWEGEGISPKLSTSLLLLFAGVIAIKN